MLSLPSQKDRAVVLQQWMDDARKLHAAGALTDAATYYVALLKAQPRNVDAKHLLGILRMQERKFAEAIRLFRQLQKSVNGSAVLEINLGDALRVSGKGQAAVGHYQSAIALDPSNIVARVNCGVTLQQMGQRDAAIAVFSDVLTLQPTQVEALNNRGSLFQELGRYDDALADFTAAITVAPENVTCRYNMANCLKGAGRPEEALEAYRALLALAPDHVDGWNNLGNLLRERGDPSYALDCFQRALALVPTDASFLNNLGAAQRALGQAEAALQSYRRAIELKPDFAIAYNNAGDTLSELGRFDEAEAAFRTAIALDASYAQPYLNLSMIHRFEQDDPLIAAMVAARADKQKPAAEQARFDFALGKAYADTKAYGDAFQNYAAGASIRRRLLPYDEIATLALMSGLKAVFTPEFVARHRASGDPDKRPIFILGMPRSGTSLIEQILASHPAVRGGGEMVALNNALRPLMARDGVFPINLADLSAEDLGEVASRYAAEVAAFAPTELRVTDKMPLNFYFVGLIALAMPNARIIHATRNPIDTCLSCFMQHFTEGHEFANDLGELGRYWRAYADLMAHWRAVLGPDAFIDVAYEKVVADMEGETRRMLDYLGLEWDDRCLAFHQSDRAVRTASLAQVRQPIYKTSVERWRVYEPWIRPLIEALRING